MCKSRCLLSLTYFHNSVCLIRNNCQASCINIFLLKEHFIVWFCLLGTHPELQLFKLTPSPAGEGSEKPQSDRRDDVQFSATVTQTTGLLESRVRASQVPQLPVASGLGNLTK